MNRVGHVHRAVWTDPHVDGTDKLGQRTRTAVTGRRAHEGSRNGFDRAGGLCGHSDGSEQAGKKNEVKSCPLQRKSQAY